MQQNGSEVTLVSNLVSNLAAILLEKKTEDLFGKEKFGYRVGKELGIKVGRWE